MEIYKDTRTAIKCARIGLKMHGAKVWTSETIYECLEILHIIYMSIVITTINYLTNIIKYVING